MGRAVFPPCSLACDHTMVGVVVTSFKMTYASMLRLPGLLYSVPLNGPGAHKFLFVRFECLCFPKVRLPGNTQSLFQIIRLIRLLWDLEHLQQCKIFFGLIAFQWSSAVAHKVWTPENIITIPENLSETHSLEPHSTPLASEALRVGPSHVHFEVVKLRLQCAKDWGPQIYLWPFCSATLI